MKKENNLNLIPKHVIGTCIDVVEQRKFKVLLEAEISFESSSSRLLSVNNWKQYAGISNFCLTDNNGNKLHGVAEIGNLIQIDIPGPGTANGIGFDWVEIENISVLSDEEQQIVSMTVRPCACPLAKSKTTAHFLTSEATSTFMIRRKGLEVFAEEHGRNEIPNVKEGTLLARGRNLIIGFAAKLGLSYPQWKSLVHGLLYFEQEK